MIFSAQPKWVAEEMKKKGGSVSKKNWVSDFSVFFEIYKSVTPLHRFISKFCVILQFFVDFSRILQKFADFSANQAFFASNFTEFCRNCGKWQRITGSLWILQKNAETFPGKRENGGYGEKGIRNRMPGKGKWQSSKSELAAQDYFVATEDYIK